MLFPLSLFFLYKMISASRRRLICYGNGIKLFKAKRNRLIQISLVLLLLFLDQFDLDFNIVVIHVRILAIRLDYLFWCKVQTTLQVSRQSYSFILSHISHRLEKQILTEEPISPEDRLNSCLYKSSETRLSLRWCKGAAAGAFWFTLHTSHVCTRACKSFSKEGHQAKPLASDFFRQIPGGAWCSSADTNFRAFGVMTTLTPHITHPFCIRCNIAGANKAPKGSLV